MKTLHTVSAITFYLLASSFFLAYVFVYNDVHATEAAWWLQVADLPLVASAMVYGGTSLYTSVIPEEKSSPVFGGILTGVLGLMFVGVVVLNFWGAMSW